MPTRRCWRHSLTIPATLATILCLSPPASAQNKSDEARVLFREARVLASSGFYQTACSKFEKSLKLEPGSGTEFNLADCWEHLGRTSSARRLYLKVAAATKNQGQEQRSVAAMDRADRLLTRLTRLQLKCAGECPSTIRVMRLGVPLKADTWAEPVDVDPGAFRIEAELADDSSWSTDLEIPNEPGTVIVSIPSAGAVASQTSVRGGATPAQPRRLAQKPAPTMATPSRPAKVAEPAGAGFGVAPTTLLVVGVGGLALSGASALWLKHKNDQASEICPTSESCTSGEIERHDALVGDAKLARVGVYSGLGLGLVSFATASIVYYLQRPHRRERDPTRASVQLLPFVSTRGDVWGAAAQGSW